MSKVKRKYLKDENGEIFSPITSARSVFVEENYNGISGNKSLLAYNEFSSRHFTINDVKIKDNWLRLFSTSGLTNAILCIYSSIVNPAGMFILMGSTYCMLGYNKGFTEMNYSYLNAHDSVTKCRWVCKGNSKCYFDIYLSGDLSFTLKASVVGNCEYLEPITTQVTADIPSDYYTTEYTI